jgi:predicted lipid-binding transport protein (Tim44 family)
VAEAFCEGGLCGGLHGGYLMVVLCAARLIESCMGFQIMVEIMCNI